MTLALKSLLMVACFIATFGVSGHAVWAAPPTVSWQLRELVVVAVPSRFRGHVCAENEVRRANRCLRNTTRSWR